MPRRVAIVVLSLLVSIPSFAQIRDVFPKPAQAAAVVREFCRLDYTGARLAAGGSQRMKSLTTFTDNPSWRKFRIVSRYDQTAEKAASHSAHITVRYLPLGIFELGIGYTPLTDPDEVEFTVKETDDGWRIDFTDPDPLAPQVSKPVAVQWLQAKLKTVSDPAEKISIETALKQLQGK